MMRYLRVTPRALRRFLLPAMLVIASVVNANNREQDRDAIYGLIDSLVACWDRADAQGLSRLWQADGDIIVPDGSRIKGRNQIENFYSGVFAREYGASTATATIGQLRFLSADLVLVDGQFVVRRVLSANNQELPPERGFFSIIAQRVSGRWLIVASREMEPLLGSNSVIRPGGGTAIWVSRSMDCLDHITIPCHDAQIAEEFYVGLLGARIVNRINRSLLRRIGWADADIDQNAAEHLSITFVGGPRRDLFVYPQGSPVRPASMHPHIALTVSPRRFLEWKQRLESHGVIVAGPTRPGLPGQASFYFNDPFGNHLELVTLGFVAFDLAVGVPDRSRLDYRWSRESAAA